ncbi:MAG: alpha/beta fold hydrolase [Desulfobacteraceae bacterium]|nr:MAG: alpha/beta fold hydrolase [Desulfobacteraceae bacterium]
MGGAQADSVTSRPDQACVVLLHGLARTHRSMHKMAAALQQAGYRTFNMDYPSREFTIEHLAMQVIPEALRQCRSTSCNTIHFVTHSMGGILVRYYLSQHPIERLGRVVMLSPPNQGSEAVDALRENAFFRWFNGPAGRQLGTGPEDIGASLGPVDYPVGVITGNVHAFFDHWLANIIPGADDGKVSVQRAKVEGMSDFLALSCSHAFIMNQAEVIAQTLYFLENGSFRRVRR